MSVLNNSLIEIQKANLEFEDALLQPLFGFINKFYMMLHFSFKLNGCTHKNTKPYINLLQQCDDFTDMAKKYKQDFMPIGEGLAATRPYFAIFE